MAFCEECGSRIPDGAIQCPACGARVKEPGNPAPTPSHTPRAFRDVLYAPYPAPSRRRPRGPS